MPKYYFYKLTHDNGGAPCIYGNLLSLAICKPMIRSTAKPGDIIIGFAASSLHKDNRLLYVAKVTYRLLNGDYFKRPLYRHRADCIYSWRSGAYHVRKSAKYHGSVKNLHQDLGKPPNYARANTLLSSDFCYFGVVGSSAYKRFFPTIAKSIAGLKQGHRVYHSPKLLGELQALVKTNCSLTGPRVVGHPSQKPMRGVSLGRGGCGVIGC